MSVIVPVRNRRALLARLLEALEAQEFCDFEVIVVDDGSTDGSGDLAEQAVIAGRDVRLVRSTGSGAVDARLAAVDVAVGEILAFTDSDCRPVPAWLSRGVAAIDAGADVVNGLTLPDRAVGPLERSIWSGEENLYPTCNVLYRREAYDKIGGFDRTAGSRWGFRVGRRARGLGACEDTLLAWQVRRAGVAAHEPEALVLHHVFSADLGEWISRGVTLGSFPAVIREIPELRDTIVSRGILFRQYSRVPFYALVVAGLLRRRRASNFFAALWVVTKARELHRTGVPASRWLPTLPACLVVDVVNAGALVAGSVRARTLVL
ncbi:MAG: hypothetical protein QOD92_1680 [Acidimicrobiaceae bacterium]